MTIKSSVLAAVFAISCSAGFAMAQQRPTEELISPQVLKRLLPPPIAGQTAPSAPSRGGGATLSAPGNVPRGWNAFHATHCVWTSDGVNNFLYVFPAEGGFWFVENDIMAANTFNVGCVNGNVEAVFVVNGATGAFTHIQTFPTR